MNKTLSLLMLLLSMSLSDGANSIPLSMNPTNKQASKMNMGAPKGTPTPSEKPLKTVKPTKLSKKTSPPKI